MAKLKYIIFILFLLFIVSCASSAFKRAKEANTINAYNWFLTKYGDSHYAEQAMLLREKRFYDNSKKRNEIEFYEEYLREYPTGKYVNEVKKILKEEKNLLVELEKANDNVKINYWISDSNGCKCINPAPQENESITWTGECKNNKVHGLGQIKWFSAGKLTQSNIGNFEDGKLNGQGCLIDENENYKECAEYKDHRLNGIGKEISYDTFSGRYDNSKSVDQIIRETVYNGEYINGKKHGVGRYEQTERRKNSSNVHYEYWYYGQWKDGKKDGLGCEYSKFNDKSHMTCGNFLLGKFSDYNGFWGWHKYLILL